MLPLGQLVVYPHVVLPLALTDPRAVQLIDEVIQGDKRLLLGVVKPAGGIEPSEGAVMATLPDQLYDVGTLGAVVRMLKLGDGSVRVMVQGLERARLKDIGQGERYLMAEYGIDAFALVGTIETLVKQRFGISPEELVTAPLETYFSDQQQEAL